MLSKYFLQSIIDIAKPRNIIVHCDEVYRPLFHGLSEAEYPPSILFLGYRNVLATISLSKAYSLAVIRVGWIASRNPDIVERCSTVRDYPTISVSHLDQCVAAYALGSPTRPHLIARNLRLAQTNADILDAFVRKHERHLSWSRPLAGTTALIKVSREGKLAQAKEFCKVLQEKTGVMLLPADKGFGPRFKGFVRIGYVNDTDMMEKGLQEWERFLDTGFLDVSLHVHP